MPISKLLAAALLCSTSGAALACELPPLVIIPEAEATVGKEAEIRAAVEQYWLAMTAYTTCIKAALDAAGGESAPSLTKAVLVQRHNHAVAEVEAVGQAFVANVTPPLESPGPSPQPPTAN